MSFRCRSVDASVPVISGGPWPVRPPNLPRKAGCLPIMSDVGAVALIRRSGPILLHGQAPASSQRRASCHRNAASWQRPCPCACSRTLHICRTVLPTCPGSGSKPPSKRFASQNRARPAFPPNRCSTFERLLPCLSKKFCVSCTERVADLVSKILFIFCFQAPRVSRFA